ncbi:hypothetical protein DM01DRAFT_1331022 [Hesseltinella vesiculosa]|uniref:Periplasmic binding protein-like II n=1 Tax=Hesseltinella vesiculosa TaxID=101127 RepID=A0A1X2GZ22_9FUNG|nr:hypothetical protein DM01DRAFT_1331022 [Hesseltinella vesiculosa]
MIRLHYIFLISLCSSIVLGQFPSCAPSHINNDPSNGFQVTYANDCSYTTVDIGGNSSYVIYNGTQPNGVSGTLIDSSALTSIGLRGDNTAFAYLELLGLASHIHYTDDPTSITSNCTAGNLTSPTGLSIVFSNTTDPFTGSNYTVQVPFNQLNRTPLQEASLILYFSFFFNLESTAYPIYAKNIQSVYTCHKENLQQSGPKTIAVTSYANGNWALQSNSSYFASLIQDAGMTIFTGDLTSLNNAQFILDISPIASFPQGFSDWLTAIGTYNNQSATFALQKNVFKVDRLVNANGYPDWFDRAPVRPDLMIQDLIHMVYPTYQPDYKSTWIRNFAKSDPVVQTSTAYPDCSAVGSHFQESCANGAFTPNGGQGSSSSTGSGGGLSLGGKVGIAVAAVMAVVAVAVAGTFIYRKKQADPPHNFYKMNDM